MTPKDFCNWFDGVLAMAEDEDGAATLNPTQLQKVREKLAEALKEPEPIPGRPGRPPTARC